MQHYAVILMGGRSQRFGRGDKCLAYVRGKPVVFYAFEAFRGARIFDHYFFVYRDEAQKMTLENFLKAHCSMEVRARIIWVQGGTARTFSVNNALEVIRDNFPTEAFVFVHDGARPMISAEMILRMDGLLSLEAGVVLAHRVTDTTIFTEFSGEEVRLIGEDPAQSQSITLPFGERTYLNRQKLWAIETPQAFYFPQIFADYGRIIQGNITASDDSSIFSGDLRILENEHLNLKITTFQDLKLFEKALS